MAKELAPAIVDEINRLHDDALAAGGSFVSLAIQCGEKLQHVKDCLPHGKFGNWVLSHCRFGVREAQRYMEMASKQELRNYTGPLVPLLGDDEEPAEREMRHAMSHLRHDEEDREDAKTLDDSGYTDSLEKTLKEKRKKLTDAQDKALCSLPPDEQNQVARVLRTRPVPVDDAIKEVTGKATSTVVKQAKPKAKPKAKPQSDGQAIKDKCAAYKKTAGSMAAAMDELPECGAEVEECKATVIERCDWLIGALDRLQKAAK